MHYIHVNMVYFLQHSGAWVAAAMTTLNAHVPPGESWWLQQLPRKEESQARYEDPGFAASPIQATEVHPLLLSQG